MSFSGFRSVRPSLLFLVLAAATIGAGCQSAEPAASASTPAPEHRIDVPALEVGVTDLESTLQISGNLVPQTRVAVLAKLPGTLSRVAVDIGDRVRVGQVVAALDRREIDAQVDAATASVNVARAGVESAEAGLANAVLEHERAQNLFEKGAVPRQRLDAAETSRRSASAQRDLATATLAQAEAALRRAREIQRDATLTSPIDGVVVERNYDAGSLVSPGDNKPVVVVADLRVHEAAGRGIGTRGRPSSCGHACAREHPGAPGRDRRGTARGDRAGSQRPQPSLRDRGAYPEPRHAALGDVRHCDDSAAAR